MQIKLASLLGEIPICPSEFAVLYRDDEKFAEICNDFVNLKSMSSTDPEVKAQIDESLSGLRQEIIDYLRANHA